MQVSDSIKRRKASDDADSFSSLRQQGMRFTQEFSGNIWTDYNAHDPGITILEQLCYGLTDLIYRANFEVADYLVDSEGKLDLEYLGLASAEQIMPCRPTTLTDYRLAILDAVNEIERLWFSPIDSSTKGYQGLYLIEIQLKDKVRHQCRTRPALQQRIIEKVSRIYAKLRNLGEDIAAVNIISGQGYSLRADIEIHSAADADDILAEIYFYTDQWLKGYAMSDDGVENYEDQLSAGNSLDQIFNGPSTIYGRLQHDEQTTNSADKNADKSKSSLYARLMEIPGIVSFNTLQLDPIVSPKPTKTEEIDDQAGSTDTSSINAQAWFYVPRQQDNTQVVIRRNNHAISVDYTVVNMRFEQRAFKQNTLRYTRQETSQLYQMPQGQYRQLQQYYSIQNDFPITYNLTVQGVSPLIGRDDFAKAQQLKGYLLIFEQLMANFGANLAGIRQLFSLDITQQKSYHFQLIDGQTVKGINQLYPESPAMTFEQILAKFDPFLERKSRLLDYLLALYGESYQLESIAQFNYYGNAQTLAPLLLKYKKNFLKSIVQLGKDRGGAYDYTRTSQGQNNQGGFYTRLAFHLGMNNNIGWATTESLRQLPLTLVGDNQYQSKLVVVSQSKRLISVMAQEQTAELSTAYKKKLVAMLSPLRNNVIGESLFKQGMEISLYKLCASDERHGFDILFPTNMANANEHCQSWLYIGNASTQQKAVNFVNIFSEFIRQLNQCSEGFHVVEHILLRPLQQQSEESVVADVYSFQISVVMPIYTARCNDPTFRVLAEAIVRENCPAHILPQCLWLNFDAMCQFEELYSNWLSQRHSSMTCHHASIEAAAELMFFLQAARSEITS